MVYRINQDGTISLENNSPQQTGKHCSWCYNAHKNKRVYTGHWLKDKNGSITCPKLLKTLCRNCGKIGHAMGKFCPEPQKPRNQLLPAKPKKNYVSRNDQSYEPGDSDYFSLSDDEEEDGLKYNIDPTNMAKEYPEIVSTTSTTQKPPFHASTETWASKLFKSK